MNWFVVNEDTEETVGPYSTEEVHKLYSEESKVLIWSHTSPEWHSFTNWKSWLKQGGAKINPMTTTQTDESFYAPHLEWFYTYRGERKGPFTKSELIQEFKNDINSTDNLFVWNKELPNWTKVSELPELTSRLPTTNKIPVAIFESLVITPLHTETEHTFLCQARALNTEELHITSCPDELTKGTEVNLSMDFLSPTKRANLRGKITNTLDSGVTVITFSPQQSEALSLVVTYLKSLEDPAALVA